MTTKEQTENQELTSRLQELHQIDRISKVIARFLASQEGFVESRVIISHVQKKLKNVDYYYILRTLRMMSKLYYIARISTEIEDSGSMREAKFMRLS